MQPSQTSSSPKLKCIGVSKSYDAEAILSSINISAKEGEIISVLGMSGSGKSTLLKIMSGLEKPDSGSVMISGQDCTGITGKVSFMRQDSLLLPWKTVIDNIILPLTIKGTKKSEAYKIAGQYLTSFGLDDSMKLYPSQISGGMAKRVSLLRAYLFTSDILLLDEPFSSLDMLTRISVYEWFLKTVRELKMTSVLVTHDINEAVYLSDKVYIIKGKPAEIALEMEINVKKQGYREAASSSSFLVDANNLASAIFDE